jgi:hypothetical protein
MMAALGTGTGTSFKDKKGLSCAITPVLKASAKPRTPVVNVQCNLMMRPPGLGVVGSA